MRWVVMLGLAGLAGCTGQSDAAVPDLGPAPPPSVAAAKDGSEHHLNPRLLRRFLPLRRVVPGQPSGPTTEEVLLGRMLFFDKRLSGDGTMSCNTCHRLDNHGVDGLPRSRGHRGKLTSRNSPTVYNAAAHFSQFWDGRATDVEAQAVFPIVNPNEMALASPAAAVKLLRAIPAYQSAFRAAFPGEDDPVTWANVGKAIGAYERVLVTPSRWDQFLAGDKNALTATELAGFKVFADVGCVTCHTGELIGGSMFQRVGAVVPWPNQEDQGRYAFTKQDSDKMVFKVPSLRGVSKTGPYFHDGSATTLGDAVRTMAKHQLGVELTSSEVTQIETWLASLTGEPPADLIAEPTLP
jgi:cytochrome c peroxidase